MRNTKKAGSCVRLRVWVGLEVWYGMVDVCDGCLAAEAFGSVKVVWYGMVDVCDGYLAAEASGAPVVWYGIVEAW